MSAIDHLLSTSYRYDIMRPRISPAKRELKTRIKRDEIQGELNRVIGRDVEAGINNLWAANEASHMFRRAKREHGTMKNEIEAARTATVRVRRAALRSLLAQETVLYDKELRRVCGKAFYVRRK